MERTIQRTLAAGALLAGLAVPPAWALGTDHEQAKGQGKSKAARRSGDQKDGVDLSVQVVFTSDDRTWVRSYFLGKHGKGKCPPGLAKKNNGCLPPGLAKKRYVIGQPLPAGVVFVDPPVEIVARLKPPSGVRLVIIDGDLVKLAVGTMLVIDAIDGLVN